MHLQEQKHFIRYEMVTFHIFFLFSLSNLKDIGCQTPGNLLHGEIRESESKECYIYFVQTSNLLENSHSFNTMKTVQSESFNVDLGDKKIFHFEKHGSTLRLFVLSLFR